MFRRIVALALAFVFCGASLVLPASAVSGLSGVYDTVKFIDALIDVSQKTVGVASDVQNFLSDMFASDYCGNSPNHFHDFVLQATQIDDSYDYYYVCKYCNTAAHDSTAYDTYVSGLDNPVVDNIGIGLPYAYEFIPNSTYVEEISSTISSFESFFFKNQSNVSLGTYYWDFAVSKDGTYTFHFPTASCTCGSSSGHCGSYMYANVHGISYSVDGGANWKTLASYSSGAISLTHTLGLYSGYLYRLFASYARDVGSLGYHAVTLSSAPYLTGGSVIQDNPSSRPSTLMQNINNYNNSVTNNTTNNTDNSTKYYIGTVDAGGDVTNVYNVNLYDEQAMVFAEPVTGAQYQTTAWTYDYTTRCYTLSLASGTFTYGDMDIDEIQISYGDEYMLLRYYSDGDLVLSDPYYYVIATETGCEHAYTSETITAPTCTEQGVRRYTCELCGYTRDEKIPATGHTWEATETVETELNENGDVTKLGYTVYTCSACGETYKQYDGTGQPGPPGASDTTSDSAFSWLASLFKKLISAIVNGLASGLEYLVENIIVTVTDLLVQFTRWSFDLLNVDSLTDWFNWFSDDNEYFANDFGGSEVDVWAYS